MGTTNSTAGPARSRLLAAWLLLYSSVSTSAAYLLMQALRRLGLQGTEWAKAQCSTLRLKLLKIGTLIRITVRKVWMSMGGGYPYAERFRQVNAQLRAVPLRAEKRRGGASSRKISTG
jgi:hypothetical protein